MGQDNDTTVLERAAMHERQSELVQIAWNNPVVKQFHQDFSFSEAGVGMLSRDEKRHGGHHAVDIQRGDHDRVWTFDAETYMKYKSSTLWGTARYDNGHTRDIAWNETSESRWVYPYFLADSVVSGRMKFERYSFSGGYADFNDHIAWGASVDYTAGLYYRSVDPRPRNVTGNLHLSAGIGIKILEKSYLSALALHFRKYKQTNNVAFMSELGHDKEFHLTGLTNDYGRFAGTAEATYYNGYQWGLSANVHPLGYKGLVFAAEASRFSFDNILSTLNELPMAHATHNEVRAEAAWQAQGWGIASNFLVSRRVGTENVFGDPASMVYPQIGGHDMYHENRFNAGLSGLWEAAKSQRYYITINPAVDYHHLNEIYAEPQGQRQINDVTWGMKAKAGWQYRTTLSAFTLGVASAHPFNNRLLQSGVKPELQSLAAAQADYFDALTHHRLTLEASVKVYVRFLTKYAAAIQFAYQRTNYHNGLHRDCVRAAVSVAF